MSNSINLGLLIELVLPSITGFLSLFLTIIAIDAGTKIEPDLRKLTRGAAIIGALFCAGITVPILHLNTYNNLGLSSLLLMVIVCFAPAEMIYNRLNHTNKLIVKSARALKNPRIADANLHITALDSDKTDNTDNTDKTDKTHTNADNNAAPTLKETISANATMVMHRVHTKLKSKTREITTQAMHQI